MATITLSYDGRNRSIQRAIDQALELGAEVVPEKRESNGLDEALEDVREGRVREITDLKSYFESLGVDV